jgi:hypothetical protein
VRKLLWLDACLGLSFGSLGLYLLEPAAALLGFPLTLTRLIALANLSYGLAALTLASRRRLSLAQAKMMATANWIWTGISLAMCWQYYGSATLLGGLFLIGQIPVVGGVALLEERLVAAAQREASNLDGHDGRARTNSTIIDETR